MVKNNRPQGMSQLDYLWLNFGGYQIGTSPSATPQQDVVLNELAVTSLIKNATNGGILSLEYKEHPTNSELVQLIGKGLDGQPITFVDMPREVSVQSFVGRTVCQVDIDNGCQYPFGTKVLSIVLTNGKEFLVSLDSLGLVLQGAETKTTVSEIKNGKIYNHVKINKAALSVVELQESTYGLSAQLNISPDKTGVQLVKADNGLKARIPLGESGKYVRFDRLSINSYMALENKDDYTVYFITDKPYIFVGSQRFGIDFDEVGIQQLAYDKESMTLTYKSHDGIKSIKLGPASETESGMFSKEDYIEFQRLRKALDGIVDVEDYISKEIDKLGASISYGEAIENKRPLYLKNGKGDVISTVWTDIETYLNKSVYRAATAEDVTNAAKAGVSLIEGDRIMILSLNNGDTHYIKLQDLVVAQSFKNSNSIIFNATEKEVSADLKINDNKIIYVTEDGVSANIQVVREGSYVYLYGHEINESKLLGKFMAPSKELTYTMFIPNITEEDLLRFPPDYVNWRTDDSVQLGNDYYLLFYKDSDAITKIYYVSIAKPQIGIAEIEGNLLKVDNNGDYYVLFEWIETN